MLAGLIFPVALTASVSKAEMPIIPETHREAVIINCFEVIWSETEDGMDWVKSVAFASDTDEFTRIYEYLNGMSLSSADNAGNFTADFSFTDGSDENRYDFKFEADDRLILRSPAGECSTVELDLVKISALRDLIAVLRLGILMDDNPLAGGYSEDRAFTAEELAMFEEVMRDMVGAIYELDLVALQVVAGTNYRFTATATPVAPDAQPQPVFVYIFKPLEGEPELVSVENIETDSADSIG
jgi:hypothetical protein